MSANTRFVFGEFSLDPALPELRARGRVVPLGRSTLLVLARLVSARGGIVTQAELLCAGWPSIAVAEGSLRQAVSELRRALASASVRAPLQTIRGEGYRLTLDVAEETPVAADTSRPRLVGRELELSRLQGILCAARAGVGKTVLLCGPAGVGKTRLAQALLDEARSESELSPCAPATGPRFDVHFTRAESDRSAPPLWPWTTLLNRIFGQLAPALRARCEAAAPSLLRLLRARTPGAPEYATLETPEQQRFLLFEELASTFARLASERPLLVVFDDLHEADELSQAFFVRLARELLGRPILLVATVRPLDGREQRKVARLLAGLDHAARPEQIALRNLTVDQLDRLFAGIRGACVGDAAERVFALTRGNPLFSLELFRLLDDERTRPAQLGELAGGALEVRAVIERRLDQLSPPARAALAAAAVIGDEFTLAELCGVTGQPSGELAEALHEAHAAAMLRRFHESDDSLTHNSAARADLRFAHPLLRETAYHVNEHAARQVLHRRFARWLERRGAGVTTTRVHELAHHFYNAGSEEDAEQAAHYLVEAAQRASASTVFDAAALLYERALRMLALVPVPDPQRELDVRIRYAEALRMAGAPAERVDALFRAASEEARGLRHATLFARAALGYAGQSRERFTLARMPNELDPIGHGLLEQALAMLGESHPELRALLLAALDLSSLYTREAAAAGTRMAEAHALSRDADPAIRARVLTVQVFMEALPGRAQQGTASDELVELASRERLPTVLVDALVTRALLHYQRGDGARVRADFREARRVADEFGGPESERRASLDELFRSYLEGRLSDFEGHTRRLFHEAGDPLRARVSFMVRMLAVQYLRHGESSHTELSFDGILEGAFAPSASLRCILAMNYASRGQRERAERELDAVAASDFAALPMSPTLVSELTMLAVATWSLGDERRAAQLYMRLLPYADRMVMYGWDALPGGPVATALGMLATTLGDLSEAARWHERAIALCRKLDAPLYEQLARSEYMRLLAQRGSADDLRKLKLYARQLESFGRLHGIGLFVARAEEAQRMLATSPCSRDSEARFPLRTNALRP